MIGRDYNFIFLAFCNERYPPFSNHSEYQKLFAKEYLEITGLKSSVLDFNEDMHLQTWLMADIGQFKSLCQPHCRTKIAIFLSVVFLSEIGQVQLKNEY
jgi:hypothetical protein